MLPEPYFYPPSANFSQFARWPYVSVGILARFGNPQRPNNARQKISLAAFDG